MIDPQDYAEIVAKRPELAVPGLAFFTVDNILDTDEAEALIGWHWTRMLPEGSKLVRTDDQDGKQWWYVLRDGCGCSAEYTPLSALTAFWRQYT